MKDETLRFYNNNAARYGRRMPSGQFRRHRDEFVSQLAPGTHILDLGCGGGHHAEAFLQDGFTVTLVDASTALAAIARARTSHDVLVRDFEDLDFDGTFDGIWAAASLLHVHQDRLSVVFQKLVRSLRPGGLLKVSFKEADTEWVDDFGRYFCAMDGKQLAVHFDDLELETKRIETNNGTSSDGTPTRWVWGTAKKSL